MNDATRLDIPPPLGKTGTTSLLREIPVGEFRDFEGKHYRSMSGCMTSLKKKGMRFTFRMQANGKIRVWRLE